MNKTLEALETIKYECGFAFGQTENGDRVRKSFPIIEKALKALDIIKRNRLFSLHDDLPKGTYRIYDGELYCYCDLTKEEYDLLKEML